MQIDEKDYYVKPMNCPFHIEVYQSRLRSYRELPLRWAELGTVYRYEKSGALHGCCASAASHRTTRTSSALRSRSRMKSAEVLRFSLYIWKCFGFTEIKPYLSTRPAKAVGEPERWEKAITSLQKAVDKLGLDCEVDEGGGAFYGPKIDLKVKDAIGREWQTATIQFDFNLPERFDMTYIGEDGRKHRPYMVHRALMGSPRAVLRNPDRAVGGGVPDVGLRRNRPGCCRCRRSSSTTRSRSNLSCAGRDSGSKPTSGLEPRGEDQGCPQRAHSVSARRRRTRSGGGRGCRPQPPRRGTRNAFDRTTCGKNAFRG